MHISLATIVMINIVLKKGLQRVWLQSGKDIGFDSIFVYTKIIYKRMEGDQFKGWNKRCLNWNKNSEEEKIEEMKVVVPILPSVPETPQEPLDFLSRSWSLSVTEISKALAKKNVHKQFFANDNNPISLPQTVNTPHIVDTMTKNINVVSPRNSRTIRRWFQCKEVKICKEQKKDKARTENAHLHSAISVAGVAAALAAVAAKENVDESGTKMNLSLASATELLASYCIEMAESAGAAHDLVASVVKSSVDIRSPSELLTLTAAAATALRGEAALRTRACKEGKKIAAISPYGKYMAETHVYDELHNESEETDPPCIGETRFRNSRKIAHILADQHASVGRKI